MTAKKTAANKVARAAAAAAAAAVNASQQQDDVQLNWSADDEEDDEVADELLEGLEQIDVDAAGGIMWWELFCSAPLDKAGQIRKLGTQELKGLRDECLQLGPGEYYVIARHKKGTFVKGSKRVIKISGYARPSATAIPTGQTFDPMVFMQQMEERAERRRMEERASRNAQIKFWAPILAPIGLEFAKGLFNRGGGEPLKDLVAALVGMKDLTGGGKSNDVENLLKGIELARDLNPDPKGSTWPDVIGNGVGTIVRELRPLAEQLAARRNGATPGTSPAQPPQLQFQTQPATPGVPAAPKAGEPPANAAPAGEMDPMLAMIEPLLRKLATELEDFAVNGADPGLAGEALLAKIPRLLRSQVQPPQLKEWLTQPDWWPITVGFHPGLQHYQAYCDDVRLALLQIVEDMINPPPDDAEERDGD